MKNIQLICLLILLPSVSSAQWTKTTLSGNKDLYDVHLLGNRAYIAGHNSALYRSDDSGKTWQSLVLTIPNNLRAVYFTSADTGFVIGENARIQKTVNGGNSWTQKYVRTAAYAYDIQFRGANGIAVGKDMLAVSSNDKGENWTVDTTLTLGKKLNSVCITPGGFCWAVGDSGFILKKHISRQKWDNLKYPTKVELNNIRNIGDSVLIICGGMPDTTQVGKYLNIFLISTDSGKTWSQTSIPEMKIINTSWFFSRDTGYLVGSNGLISKCYQPFTQRGLQLTATASAFNGISYFNKCGIIVGDGGLVLRTTNGGGFGMSIDKPNSSFDIYPNPSDGRFYIKTEMEISEISVTDVSGRTADFSYEKESGEISINAVGLLYIRIALENGIYLTQTVLINY